MPSVTQIVFICLAFCASTGISVPLRDQSGGLNSRAHHSRSISDAEALVLEARMPPAQPVDAEISLMRAHVGTAKEHWGIFIKPSSAGKALDSVLIDGAAAKEGDLVTPLSGEERKWETGKPNQEYTKIGTAKWGTKTAYTETLKKLKTIELGKAPTATGGNCIDYAEKELEILKTEAGLSDISAFTKLKTANYEKVKDATWGAKAKGASGSKPSASGKGGK